MMPGMGMMPGQGMGMGMMGGQGKLIFLSINILIPPNPLI